ncbi:MAG: phospholipid carrier-dependent glycosyltransferase [Hydrotalea flava]|uniref:ArnT family glycosyltransferase n=1 Tax=Hydrotalea TaxID=1004300 RepID=UPI0016A267F6|nr:MULTISPECIES: glycosyltransferase family 39 protein [Hydrotalea]MBY0347397.1 glycosyltransferase family 39 protein [Hydrotalea flava]NIM36343.1 phospholipid carrier-dependent glycosyltransferase [Hydrotalea flava]NIM39198.1 phospholipid carrier-dependent glycosyltransferase [Hydrotalea flava]NIN04437.1 phospholipid carrier-dependent glycosyltransferase [Hydrotalea flava]NIN16057.1 phospholipid carrier-dependent glycosyltransferase [Hydrotalea flava]
MMAVSYKKLLYRLLIITILVKIFISLFVELGIDESYYWMYAIQPDWNHFDHPPMVGFLIRLSTLNLHWVNDVSMRLGAIFSGAVATIFIFKTGRLLKNERIGWYAALIYNCSIYTAIIAGMFIMPDSPQMVFWTAALYLMAVLLMQNKEKSLGIWLLLGLMIGLALYSKVHGLYLWTGFGLFIIIKKPKWLLNYRLYVSVLVSLLFVVPIVWWNIQNDFITYRYHSERVTHTTIQVDDFLREVIGEFAYQNPVVFILLIVAIIYVIKNRSAIFNAIINTWIICMSIPMIFLFWGISMFNATLPHWSGPAYIPLYFFGAVYLEKISVTTVPGFLKTAYWLLGGTLLLGILLVQLAPFNLGSQDKANFGEYCPTLDVSGWTTFSHQLDTLMKADVAKGTMQPDAPIIVGKMFPGGHLEYYTHRITGHRVIAIGPLDEIHKFAWLNNARKPLQIGDDAYCVVPSNLPFDPHKAFDKYFTTIEQPEVINQIRGGKIVRYFYVYRMKNCKALPTPLKL